MTMKPDSVLGGQGENFEMISIYQLARKNWDIFREFRFVLSCAVFSFTHTKLEERIYNENCQL